MTNYNENYVEEALKKLKKVNEKIIDENTRIYQRLKIDILMAQYAGEDRVVTSDEIVEMIKENPLPEPIATGHAELDAIIKGFYPGQHIIFSAPPKSGKTSYIMDLVGSMKQHNPMLIPLEQNAEELISILQERNLAIPYFSVPRTNKKATLKWLADRITESVVKYDTKVVFIDHFGYIKMVDEENQHHLKIIDTMQAIRSIAKQLNISIVSIVHTRKTNPTTPPTVEDLYGSAGYLQEADTVIMLWREAYSEKKEIKWTNRVLVSVQANRRNGETGNFRMEYINHKFVSNKNIVFHFESDNVDEEEELRKKFNNF